MARVRIRRDYDDPSKGVLISAYDERLVTDIKMLPRHMRWWNAKAKAWYLPWEHAEDVSAHLSGLGHRVDGESDAEQRMHEAEEWIEQATVDLEEARNRVIELQAEVDALRAELQRARRSQPVRSQGDWVLQMYVALPDHLRKPVHRALIKVLHPDIGGDTDIAKRINATFSGHR